jgi:hypothetical protein
MISKIIKTLNLDNMDDTLIHISDLCVDNNNLEIIKYLHEKECIDKYLEFENINIGDKISFGVIWAELNTLGIYKYASDFIAYNSYTCIKEFYILELNCFNDTDHKFIDSYFETIKLIDAFDEISSHSWEDEDCKHVVLSHSNKSIILDIKYDSSSISLDQKNIDAISNLNIVLREANEKQKLFINELVDFLLEVKGRRTLSLILSDIVAINRNSNDAYDFYLSNFSAHKLKFEIDSKAIDFTQKIHTVINDAQTKLIAIPTAFVLAAASMDFEGPKIMSVKNICIVISLWIFALLIQLFLSNQKSILEFIKLNIDEYKDTFKNKEIGILSNSFKKVELSLSKQFKRLQIIGIVLWLIPMILTIVPLFIYYTLNICTVLKILILPLLLYIILAIKIMMK